MVTLFDEQTIRDIHDYNIAKDAEEKGLQKGLEKGNENGIRTMVLLMRKLSMDRNLVIQQLMDDFGLSAQAAEEKVGLYWN